MLRLLGGDATVLRAPSRQRGGESRLQTRHIPSYNKTFPHRVVDSSDTTSLNLGKSERNAKPLVELLHTEQSSGQNNGWASVRATCEVLNLKPISKIC